jgi:4-deoxy-L-threo-5-hexosulose-uronate ketol-isomerase
LPVQTEPASAAVKPFLECCELGLINVGAGSGSITVDGAVHPMKPRDGLHLPMGSADVVVLSDDPADPARDDLTSPGGQSNDARHFLATGLIAIHGGVTDWPCSVATTPHAVAPVATGLGLPT